MRLLCVDARVTGRDRQALAVLIESADADLACVHHGPHRLRWRSISAALGRRSGLVVVSGGRPAAANLLLSSLGVDCLDTRDIDLHAAGRRPAGAALAVLRHGGERFTLVCARLVGNAAERLEQARRLQDAIVGMAADRPPAIVCVTGAERPGTAAWQALAADRIPVADRIFVDGAFVVASSRELPDHAAAAIAPVVVELSRG